VAGRWSPGTPPPEVPEEFAAAYRAAYERAMAAQAAAPPGVHADREHDVPAREGPGSEPDEDEPSEDSVAFFDSAEVEEAHEVGAPSLFERVRDSGWLVPLLLLILAVLLVAGAYAVGRVFSGSVAGADSSAQVPHAVAGAAPHEDRGDPSPFGGISL
jgi:hypothetical protein